MTLPPCLLKAATGNPCPSCGMTRAVLAIGHGDWAAAFSLHPLSLVFLAEMAILAFVLTRRRLVGLPIRPPQPIIDRLIVANILALLGVWGLRLAGGWRG